jgi:type III pantothenate kinase
MSLALAVSIGNTRTQIGRIVDGVVQEFATVSSDTPTEALEQLVAWSKDVDKDDRIVLLASVRADTADAMRSLVVDQIGAEIIELEKDLPVPIGRALDSESIIGVDRLLAAAAAWNELKQACIIVDVGTAVTVDFVDGEGVFQGGAILPGTRAMLDSLTNSADLLPSIDYLRPEGEPFGRNTTDAMLRGVHNAIHGGVWKLVENYALFYGGFPLVIATGGDAESIFADDELVSRIVPDLALRGCAVSYRTATEDSNS